jgi:acetolactate synthase I/II/III large subunit
LHRNEVRRQGYRDTKRYATNAKVIHMEIDPAEINKIIHADAPVLGNVKESLPMLTEKVSKNDHSMA